MKKTGLLLLLLAIAANAQDASNTAADANAPQGTAPDVGELPVERVQTPTYADMYCAGFINKSVLPDANYVAGGLQLPNTTKFVTGDIVYLAGPGYTTGGQYSILRELKDQNRYEVFPDRPRCWRRLGSLMARSAAFGSWICATRWPLVKSSTAVTRSILVTSLCRSPRSRRFRSTLRLALTALSRPARPAAASCSQRISTRRWVRA